MLAHAWMSPVLIGHSNHSIIQDNFNNIIFGPAIADPKVSALAPARR